MLAFLIVRFIRWTWPLRLWLCGARVDIGLGAGKFEGRGAEVLSLCHCLLDLRDSRAGGAWRGKRDAVDAQRPLWAVRENGMDLVRQGP
jgi:hypothetical protein